MGQYIRQHFIRLLLIITCVGGGLRLGAGVELLQRHSAVTRPPLSTDMATYLAFAQQIRDGAFDWSQGFYYQPFYYTVALPLMNLIPNGWGILLGQTAMGMLVIWLTGLSAALLFGKRAGVIAALLVALHRTLIFYTPYALMAVLNSLWMILILYLAIRASRRRRARDWALVGLVCGGAIVTRGNAILFVPLLVLLAVACHRRSPRQAVTAGALVVAMSWLPQLPYSLVNYRVHGHWVGPSSAGAAVLALGNTPEAPPGGRDPGTGPGPMHYPASCELWTAQAKASPPEQVSIQQNIWSWVKREPLAYLELKFRMLLLFWNRAEVPNNIALTSADGRWVPSQIIRLPIYFPFLVIGGLGMAGWVLALWFRRRSRTVLFAAALMASYALSIVLFYVLTRFRLPILPVVAVFAGYLPVLLWRRHRLRQREPARANFLYVVGVAVIAILGCGVAYDVYRFGWEAQVMRLARPHGVPLRFPDRWLAMDHGPMPFGGWVPTAIDEPIELKKTFVLPESAQGRRFALRVPISAPPGAPLRVRIGESSEASWQNVAHKGGLLWHTFDVAATDLVQTDREATVTVVVQGTSDAFVIVDGQRVYGRTAINGTVANAEWVAELVAHAPAD